MEWIDEGNQINCFHYIFSSGRGLADLLRALNHCGWWLGSMINFFSLKKLNSIKTPQY